MIGTLWSFIQNFILGARHVLGEVQFPLNSSSNLLKWLSVKVGGYTSQFKAVKRKLNCCSSLMAEEQCSKCAEILCRWCFELTTTTEVKICRYLRNAQLSAQLSDHVTVHTQSTHDSRCITSIHHVIATSLWVDHFLRQICSWIFQTLIASSS